MSSSMTGGVDSSIPLAAGRIGQGGGNTLASPGPLMDTLSKIQQMQLFPGQLQRQQQEIQQGDIGIQQGGIKTQSDQLALTNSQNASVAGYLIPVLNNPDPKLNHITNAYGQAAGPGNLKVDRQVDDMKTWPGDNAPLAERKAWLAARAAPAVSAQERLAATSPTYVGAANQGDAIQPLVIPGALSGQPRVVTPSGAALPTTLTPAEKAGRVTSVGAGGQPGTVPLTSTVDRFGNPLPQPAIQGGSPPPSSAAPPVLGAGGQPGNPPGFIATGMPPGTNAPAEASGTQFAAAQTAAGGFTNRVLPLRQAIDLLSETDTGPASQTLNHFRSTLISLANQGLLPKAITPDAIQQAKFDELRKYMANYITNMPFASGSDARMAEAISGNPNVEMSTIANRDLAKVLVGLERFRQAQYLGFSQAAKNGEFGDAARSNVNLAAQSYGDWAAKFNTQYDPRAFAVDLMGGPQSESVRKLYNSLSETQQTRFRSSLKFANSVPGLMQ